MVDNEKKIKEYLILINNNNTHIYYNSLAFKTGNFKLK